MAHSSTDGPVPTTGSKMPAGPARVALVPDFRAPVPASRASRGPARRAVIEFVDAVREADLAALRREGYDVLSNAPGSNRVMVRLADAGARDPMTTIPRILRFRLMML